MLRFIVLGALKPGGVVGLLGSSFGAIIGSWRERFPAIIVPFLSGRVLVSIMVSRNGAFVLRSGGSQLVLLFKNELAQV
jgi:hypothetical protein